MNNNFSRNNKKVQTRSKPCLFCIKKGEVIDYKNTQVLRRFVSSFMKIAPRRRSGLCALHQRKVSKAIKQARIAGLLPYIPR